MKKFLILTLSLLMVSLQLFAQARRVTGRITDEAGEPVPGANILEKNTVNGTSSDVDGNFSFNLQQPNSVLVISYVGYLSEKVQVTGSHVNVQLVPDIVSLSEVVVVA